MPPAGLLAGVTLSWGPTRHRPRRSETWARADGVAWRSGRSRSHKARIWTTIGATSTPLDATELSCSIPTASDRPARDHETQLCRFESLVLSPIPFRTETLWGRIWPSYFASPALDFRPPRVPTPLTNLALHVMSGWKNAQRGKSPSHGATWMSKRLGPPDCTA